MACHKARRLHELKSANGEKAEPQGNCCWVCRRNRARKQISSRKMRCVFVIHAARYLT
ncbi:hypothetical protein CES85_1601 [Ochrobactrum quorumnocens]|uniref:Uncharacterized protein n=1 Tax=Ochrobactrum quorumnocens TaxID=271865 RepID=A0A248UIH8_9HYPH|nr:hypothetical protein CES85_1601 [[Ochrobactrum] quorumnocens]